MTYFLASTPELQRDAQVGRHPNLDPIVQQSVFSLYVVPEIQASHQEAIEH